MPKTAKVEEPTHVINGNDVLDLSDGSRQVTEAEAETLQAVLGSAVTIEDSKPTRKGRSHDG